MVIVPAQTKDRGHRVELMIHLLKDTSANWRFFCSGKPIKCDSSDTSGCEGCTRKDCCLGDCGGYPKEN